ncbi:hypothetical protein SLS58_008637 [Diplodia intermedia]|uniref:DUF6594 domain-containing protein n=1 Tax=Diplodia intermedia TaxID=856260 RepID=A0ABR3TH85_9PEZI
METIYQGIEFVSSQDPKISVTQRKQHELLVKSRETSSFQRPSDRDYNSVRTWFNNVKPLTDNDSREWAGFDGLIESSLRKFDCKLVRAIFQPRDLAQKTNDESIYYYSAKRVETFVAMIITIIIFFLLVLPVVAMYKLTSVGDKASTFDAIGVLVVFTLLFSAAMSLLTKAKRHELFAASAAYCAVLVVFISNFSGSASDI